MTPEDRQIAEARLNHAFATRLLYRNVYSKDDAVVTIAQMMDEAGYYSTNPETINPQLIAAVNRLLNSIGSIHPKNTFSFAKAIIGVANDEDLNEQRALLSAEEE